MDADKDLNTLVELLEEDKIGITYSDKESNSQAFITYTKDGLNSAGFTKLSGSPIQAFFNLKSKERYLAGGAEYSDDNGLSGLAQISTGDEIFYGTFKQKLGMGLEVVSESILNKDLDFTNKIGVNYD